MASGPGNIVVTIAWHLVHPDGIDRGGWRLATIVTKGIEIGRDQDGVALVIFSKGTEELEPIDMNEVRELGAGLIESPYHQYT